MKVWEPREDGHTVPWAHGKGKGTRRDSKATFEGSLCQCSHVPNSGCGEIHAESRLLRSLTGKRDLRPVLVLLNPSFAGLKSQQPSVGFTQTAPNIPAAQEQHEHGAAVCHPGAARAGAADSPD